MTEDVPFLGVPDGLVKALQTKGFSELTAVQKAVLRPDLAGRDLRMSSQTGSGKTVAIGFVLAPELSAASNGESGRRKRPVKNARPDVLVIAPTRELAVQLGKEFTWLFRGIGAEVVTVTGGTNLGLDFSALARNPSVLIGTPGRLVDHLERGSVDLSGIRAVVLDEADEMLDMGFRDELQKILERAPADRRTHLVSATFPAKVRRLADSHQSDAIQISGTKIGAANTDIQHVALCVADRDRVAALINVLLTAPKSRTLVFTRTRIATSRIASELVANGFAAASLSGDMSQRERTATLETFRRNAIQCLVATDVAARGLDIDDVVRVVHFDLPDDQNTYTHRSGRTGRAGNQGTSIALVPPSGRGRMGRIAAGTRVTLEWRDAPTADDIFEAADDRLLQEYDKVDHPDDRLQALAAKLLAERDAVEVVAKLLGQTDHRGPCKPQDVRPVSSQPKKTKYSKVGDRNDNKFAGDRGPGSRTANKRKPHDGAFTLFNVSWGGRQGANPNRLVALACRRGGVRSNNLGAIRIRDGHSTIEVASHLAENFAKAARRPDPRDPHIRILPDDGKKGYQPRNPTSAAKHRASRR